MTQDVGLMALSKPLVLEVCLGRDIVNYLAVSYGISIQDSITARIYPNQLSEDAYRAFTKLIYAYMQGSIVQMQVPIENSLGYNSLKDKTWWCSDTSVIDESDSGKPVISIDKALLLWEKDYDESKAAVDNRDSR